MKLPRQTYIFLLPFVLGLGAGIVGPFGTYVYAPPFARIFYWILVTVLGCALWTGLSTLGRKMFQEWPYEWGELIVSIPFSFLNPWLLVILHLALNAVFGSRFPTVWSDFVVSHLILSVFVILPTIYFAKQIILDAETIAGRRAIDLLFDKLPMKLRGSAPFALAAEGNYVRVYTEKGDDIVLSTFDEAVSAVSGIPGVRTHRSWWVAESEIQQITKTGSSFEVQLKSGLKIPLSRRRRRAIEPIVQKIQANLL